MTRLTALLIREAETVETLAQGPMDNGYYAFYIGIVDRTPSGWPWRRPLLTSEALYATPEAAKAVADAVVAEIRSAASEAA